jgi:KDO2-lipid IV(A) lauroyltransferase
METVENPDLQAYFMRTRTKAGLTLVPTQGAGRVLAARLEAGEAVAIVADRVVSGNGARVEFFGAPARLPLGPAVLALETSAPAWAVATRRTGWGDYRAELERIQLPDDGTRRERLAAFMANQARAFERLIAAAPEQWWAIFFPIWDDQR